jgi:hypothetical protein
MICGRRLGRSKDLQEILMLKSDKNSRWIPSFLLCFAVGSLAIAASNPVMADERRSCRFEVEVKPTESGREDVIYTFVVFNTVEHRIDANDGRRAIRQRVTNCILGHWNDRNETRPYACQDSGRIEMSQYPFNNMYEQIRQDICDKNRDQLRLPVNIKMFIRGERGCLERSEDRGVDPVAVVSIASNYRFNCPIREGGASERGPGTPPDRPPLPNIRLPGNDLLDIPLAERQVETWQQCWSKCDANNNCLAWTFRAANTPGTGPHALCLQKSGEGAHVSDTCCQSGVKE